VSTAVDCKRSLEIEIPLEDVQKAKEEITETIRNKARLPGFRPGKAPVSLIRSRFQSEIRSEVLDKLLPQAFRARVEKEDIKVVGTPDISDLHYEPDEPIRFKAEFEVAPEFEISPYTAIPVQYVEPGVTDEEVDARVESMRETKAEYVNVDPRPIETGDYVVVHVKSVSGLAENIDQDALQVQVGSDDTLPEFSQNLLGATPEEVKEFDVVYPEDYGQERLAGKTVRFQLTPKVIRRKELPAVDDEFARDLGDYQTLEELKTAVRKSIAHEKQFAAQQTAKEALIDKLIDANDFPVPEAYVDRQIENQVRSQLSQLAGKGIDPNSLKLDWAKLKESQREKALRNVKAALLLEKIADREAIHATRDEVDREVQLYSKREREPIAVVRAKLEKEGTISRIADHIRTEKTIQFLFEQAEKQA
jgi:trigger factor